MPLKINKKYMKTIVLNHKMNLYYQELDNYLKNINKIENNLIIAPSNIYLIEFLKKTNHQIASQDVCYVESGNYTGKVSWRQIKSLGIKYSIIGHSEKKDDIKEINDKVNICIDNEITPILCFSNEPNESIIEVLDRFKIIHPDKVIYAYEPIDNIGSNNINVNNISQEINLIYNYLTNKLKQRPNLLYGGGINENNIDEIYHLEKLNGILLGSKSSNIEVVKNLLMKINEK